MKEKTNQIQAYEEDRDKALSLYLKEAQSEHIKNPLEVIKKNGSFGKFLSNKMKENAIQIKYEIECNNLDYHRTQISNKIKQLPFSEETAQKLDLKIEWFAKVGHISPEEEILSAIWQGWFIELKKGCNVSDYKIYLEKMEIIGSAEAELLLSIGNISIIFNPNHRYRRGIHIGKVKYLLDQLLEKELIEKISFMSRFQILPLFFFLVIVICGLFSALSFDEFSLYVSKSFSFNSIWLFGLGTITLSGFFGVFYYTLFRHQVRYRLTWIGEGLVRFSKSIKSEL